MRLGVVLLTGLLGCSLNESSPVLDDADDPDAQPGDSLSVEVNCPDAVELVACLSFDGTTADQIHEHDINVVSGETSFVEGVAGSAIELGANVIAPFERAGDFETASATIELWLGPDPQPGFIFDYDRRLSIELDDADMVHCVAQTPEGQRSVAAVVDIARWSHVACVFGSERGIEMYIDRTMVGQNPTAVSFEPSPSRTAHLGSDSPGGDDAFSGVIDNLRIWQRNMPAEDLCAECALIDDPNA